MTIFLDDADTYLVARSRRDMLDALLAHLPEEPELWQLQMIGAACLGHRARRAWLDEHGPGLWPPQE